MILSEQFDNNVLLYVHAFMRKHRLFDFENGEYYPFDWVGGDVGGILEISDYYIGFDDIRYDINNRIHRDNFFKWYDYCLENEKTINYKSWLSGAR